MFPFLQEETTHASPRGGGGKEEGREEGEEEGEETAAEVDLFQAALNFMNDR